MSATVYNQLIANLDYLKLPQMQAHLSEVTDFVVSNKLSFTEGLLKLCNYEIDYKSEAAAKSMVKAAAFPFIKTLDDYDCEFQPGVNKQKLLELATLCLKKKKKNIVFLGNSGVGKTHLATAIGIVAAKKRISTYFIKCHDLLQQLKRAKLENRLDYRLKTLMLLYGLYYAKDAIKERDSIIIMEGYFDVISSQAHGLKNCVASCGTSLTTEHIKIMSRYTKSRRIYLSFDT